MIKYWSRTNSPDYEARTKERFQRLCSKKTKAGCIIWNGSKDKIGYGHFRYKNNVLLSHRMALILSGAHIDNTEDVLHKCDNPSCVNPEHLFVGSHADNMMDKARKGRSPSKLTVEQVKFIKSQIAKGVSCNSLATKFGVNHHTVDDIRDGVTWKHVTM